MMHERALEELTLHRMAEKECLPLDQPLWLVAYLLTTTQIPSSVHRNLGHAYTLHNRPHDGQTAGFRGEGINLIGSLPDVAKKAFNGVRGPDVAMHDLRKRV